jgi:hypothetical protein
MKRRSFLVGSAAATLTSWPAWIARAFDPDSTCSDGERIEGLFDSYRQARRAGKPLLVLIIPTDDEKKWERGTWFGQVLNYGTDDTLALLSLVTLSCATSEELGRLVQLDATDAEPTFVTVDTASRPARARPYQLDLNALVPERWKWMGTREDFDSAMDRAVDAQIVALSVALKDAIAALIADRQPEPTRYEHEQLARAILHDEEHDDAAVLRFAHALYQRAQVSGPLRAKLIAGLASAVRSQVVSHQVRGSHWASSGGCGVRIEGDDSPSHIACGMGYSPARSQRFLYFFTVRERATDSDSEW